MSPPLDVSASARVASTPHAPRQGYDASPPQPLLPGEAVGEVELPDKAGIRRVSVCVWVCVFFLHSVCSLCQL